ncbi:MAG TPA: family 20 glycosylhydrolase [Pirellulales bacterium]
MDDVFATARLPKGVARFFLWVPRMQTARKFYSAAFAVVLLFRSAFAAAEVPPTAEHPWRALHLINIGSDAALRKLAEQLPDLAKLGINCLIVEVDYSYAFESHPELRQGESPISKEGAKTFRTACDKSGIELVPQFQCLGHQSWKEHTGPLLTKYPELDLTPGAFPDNKNIYCREWNPLNPKTNEIVFPLIDELIDAFDAKAFHVGMDEVFLLASDKAPSTKGHDPADVFAKAVNDLHDHIVTKRGLTMLMWADRLIDGKQLNMGEWEASKVGTAAAVDKIPKDIILCPWHYELRDQYESLPMFMEKGFRVLPASWKNTDATLALINDARAHQKDDLLVGHIFTTWSQRRGDWANFEPLTKGLKLLRNSNK